MGRSGGSLALEFLAAWAGLVPLVLLLLAAQPAAGRFMVEKNSLMVTSPDHLRGQHDSAIGNFGLPQYGGSLAGTVVYPKANADSCGEFLASFRSRIGALPNFMLVDRGGCIFAKKVWNAQNAGASAVLVVDDTEEPLITMDLPREDDEASKYIQNITIPSALIDKKNGEQLKKAYGSGEMVNVNLDWREAVPHPDDHVEYELWTNSNDECGPKCDMLMDFVKDFKGAAQILEKGGYSQFTPHYITWYCPQAFTVSKQCKSQCINHGRYCAPDPEQDFSKGYEGKDVVTENLRQLCVFRVANESKKPWVWWDYVTDFHIRCPMKEKKYIKECADNVIKSLGLDADKIEECMGDPNTDSENPVLKEEQDAQDKFLNITACKDTFRGRVCECPIVQGVQFKGDGYSNCEASGPGRCRINSGGCWQDTQRGHTFSACLETGDSNCQCPLGFRGDGIKSCEDINECKEKRACQCPECGCKNTWGSYECSCSGDLLYIRDQDACIAKRATESNTTWAAVWIILIGLSIAAVGAYIVYKYRLKSYMDSEIRAIMAQYMPLDSQGEISNHAREVHA